MSNYNSDGILLNSLDFIKMYMRDLWKRSYMRDTGKG